MAKAPQIYVSASKDEYLSDAQRSVKKRVYRLLDEQGFQPWGYHYEGPLRTAWDFKDASKAMAQCQGALILGFTRWDCKGLHRVNEDGLKVSEGNHFEGGLAIAHDVPLLVIKETPSQERGILAEGRDLPRVPMPSGSTASWVEEDDCFKDEFERWCDHVTVRAGELQRPREGRPSLFISHRHEDEEIARALVDCIKSYFKIEKRDIRCTSVRPYRLPVGENTAERLRDEIACAEAVLGILTPSTQASSYVLFELGSAWGQGVWTCPLLARGADQTHIPDPIRDLSPLSLEDSGDCLQLLDDMRGFTSLERGHAEGSEVHDKITNLSKAAAVEVDVQS